MEDSKNWYVLVERNHDQVDRAVETVSIQEACAHSGNSTGAGLVSDFWKRLPVGAPEARFDVYRVKPEASEFLKMLENSSASEIRSLSTSKFSDQSSFHYEGSWGIPAERVNEWIDQNETPLDDSDYSYEALPPVSPDSMSREDAEQFLADQRQSEENMQATGQDDIEALNRETAKNLDAGQKDVEVALEAAKKARDVMSLSEINQEQELNKVAALDDEHLEKLEDPGSESLSPEQVQDRSDAGIDDSSEVSKVNE